MRMHYDMFMMCYYDRGVSRCLPFIRVPATLTKCLSCLHLPVEMISAASVRFTIWNKSLSLQHCKSSNTLSWEWPLRDKRSSRCPTTEEGGSHSLMSKVPIFRALTKVLHRVCETCIQSSLENRFTPTSLEDRLDYNNYQMTWKYTEYSLSERLNTSLRMKNDA